MNREEITIRMVKSSQLGKIDKHAGWNTSEKSKRACPSSDCSKRQLWVHCKFLPHENYRDWEMRGPGSVYFQYFPFIILSFFIRHNDSVQPTQSNQNDKIWSCSFCCFLTPCSALQPFIITNERHNVIFLTCLNIYNAY